MGGIAGRRGERAYSILVGSSQYDDHGRDESNTLERTDRPVRVLRRKNDNHWALAFGICYDGLYNAKMVGQRPWAAFDDIYNSPKYTRAAHNASPPSSTQAAKKGAYKAGCQTNSENVRSFGMNHF
ncbi:hypothetical protein MAPG_11320 [Magnaporthiopsis poae ATCC 64411]|uniref:Uncharacterized protein n=1 Tax=Magnaporthiopsis poae (strain ATCC 64411 / 73-15) TaxID=644358 RepID=A0A0C4EEY8_MAGP6|nr:hypothetical protein MAPG_11320 [Magnaporthiopsis poae ATCC 64411]